MKNLKLFLKMAVMIIFFQNCFTGVVFSQTPINISDYDLIFCDGFNGGELDPNVWAIVDNSTIGITHMTSDLVSVEGGKLVLSVKEVPSAEFSPIGKQDEINASKKGKKRHAVTYFGAQVSTQLGSHNGHLSDELNYKYGYYEIECSLPGGYENGVNKGYGFFPAFWLSAKNGPRYYGTWPPEIDGFELAGSHQFTSGYFEITKEDYWGLGVYETDIDFNILPEETVNASYYGVHTYGILWEPNKITFFKDRVSYGSVDYSISVELRLVLSFKISSGTPADPALGTDYSRNFEINYVKIYQPKEPYIEYPSWGVGWSNEGVGQRISNWVIDSSDIYVPGDFTGDGRDELYSISPERSLVQKLQPYVYGVDNWEVLYNPMNGKLDEPFRKDFNDNLKVLSGDIDNDGIDEILVINSSGYSFTSDFNEIEDDNWEWDKKWDNGTTQQISDWDISNNGLDKYILGNYDADLADELLCISASGRAAVYDFSFVGDMWQWVRKWDNEGSHLIEDWRISTYSTDKFLSGDFDDDGVDELLCISVTGFASVFDFSNSRDDWFWDKKWGNGGSHYIDNWRISTYGTDQFFSGDFDDDGFDELLGVSQNGFVKILNFNKIYDWRWEWESKWGNDGSGKLKNWSLKPKDKILVGNFDPGDICLSNTMLFLIRGSKNKFYVDSAKSKYVNYRAAMYYSPLSEGIPSNANEESLVGCENPIDKSIIANDENQIEIESRIHPNPFDKETTIIYSLEKNSKALIIIYDISGKKIKTLKDSELISGDHSVTWDGTNDSGHRINSGIYFCKIETDSYQRIDKIVYSNK